MIEPDKRGMRVEEHNKEDVSERRREPQHVRKGNSPQDDAATLQSNLPKKGVNLNYTLR